MHCSNCGSPIEASDRFCGSCGAAVGQSSTVGRRSAKHRWSIVLLLCLLIATLFAFVMWTVTLPRLGERSAVREAEALVKERKFQLAVEHIASEIDKHPKSARLRYWLGVAYLNLDRTDEARRVFEDAVRIDPNVKQQAARAALQVGRSLFGVEGGNAWPHLQIAGALAPELTEDEEYSYMTLIAMPEGPDRKIVSALKFTQRFPDSKHLPNTYLVLASAYENSQRFEDALKTYKSFLQKASADSRFSSDPRFTWVKETVAEWREYVSRRLGFALVGIWYARAGWQEMTFVFRDDGTGFYQYADTLSAPTTYNLRWRVERSGFVTIQVDGIGEVGGPYEFRGRTLIISHSGQLQRYRLLYQRK